MWNLVAAAFVAFLWGCAPHLHKNVSSGFDPRDFIICSGICYFGLVCVLALTRLSHILRNNVFTRCNLQRVFTFTCLFIFVPNVVYVWALQNSPSVRSVISVTYLAPIFTVMMGFLYFGDSLGLRRITGTLLLIVGALLLRA